jgi:hypothetical protein
MYTVTYWRKHRRFTLAVETPAEMLTLIGRVHDRGAVRIHTDVIPVTMHARLVQC